MKSINISVIDNDHVVRTKTNFPVNEKNDMIIKLIEHISDGFVPGETAYLEIEGFKKDPITFEISQFE